MRTATLLAVVIVALIGPAVVPRPSEARVVRFVVEPPLGAAP